MPFESFSALEEIKVDSHSEKRFTVNTIEEIREHVIGIISKANNSITHEQTIEYNNLLTRFIELGGPKDDIIVRIGESLFNFVCEDGLNDRSKQGPREDEPIEGSFRLGFDYLEEFMVDTFIAVGVPEREAKISANVLIEADKTGVDSHGVGRLKVYIIIQSNDSCNSI